MYGPTSQTMTMQSDQFISFLDSLNTSVATSFHSTGNLSTKGNDQPFHRFTAPKATETPTEPSITGRHGDVVTSDIWVGHRFQRG